MLPLIKRIVKRYYKIYDPKSSIIISITAINKILLSLMIKEQWTLNYPHNENIFGIKIY
jgi:hypothetical protein